MARITSAAAQRLRDELAQLVGPGRDEVAEALLAARGAGKMEENSDYWIAAEARDRLESRISAIRDVLAEAEITDALVTDADVVVEGCVVELRFEGDEDVEAYYVGDRLGAPEELDIVTVGSPLGQALLGAHAGDQIQWLSPNGARLSAELTTIRTA